jgi:hypothetical protein
MDATLATAPEKSTDRRGAIAGSMYPAVGTRRSPAMDVGRTYDKDARRGRSVVTRMCVALGKTLAFLAAVMRFLAESCDRWARRFHAAHGRLEGSAQRLNAQATGVPLGADLADEEWEEPALLPLAEPPPIPPAAFFAVKTPPAQDEEWAAAILAAKQSTPSPEPTEEDWEAALLAAKRAHEVPAVKAPEPPPATPPKLPAQERIGELRVGPKPATARAVPPRATLMDSVPRVARSEAKALGPAADSKIAAATRQVVAAALRS